MIPEDNTVIGGASKLDQSELSAFQLNNRDQQDVNGELIATQTIEVDDGILKEKIKHRAQVEPRSLDSIYIKFRDEYSVKLTHVRQFEPLMSTYL